MAILNASDVIQAWNSFSTQRTAMERRRNYFNGEQRIPELETVRIDGRQKSLIRTNWVKYVTALHSGFLAASPATFTPEEAGADEAPIKGLREVYRKNSLAVADLMHLENMVLYGFSPEVGYFDGTTVRFSRLDPVKCTPIRDDSGTPSVLIYRTELPAWSIWRKQLLRQAQVLYYVYEEGSRRCYAEGGPVEGTPAAGGLNLVESAAIRFPGVPFHLWEQDDNLKSFVSDALLLQSDVYDVTRSSLTDDIKFNVDSLLKMTGMEYEPLLDKDKDGVTVWTKLKELGILPLPEGAEAGYVQRDVAVEKFKYDLKVTRASIHLMGCVPDLDETIGGNEGTITNISGIALKLMFHSMILQASRFAGRHESALRQRVDLVNRIHGVLRRPVLEGYEVKIHQAIPRNDIEILQYITNLKGVLARVDQIRMLPWIESPQQAYKNLVEEERATAGAGGDLTTKSTKSTEGNGGSSTTDDTDHTEGEVTGKMPVPPS